MMALLVHLPFKIYLNHRNYLYWRWIKLIKYHLIKIKLEIWVAVFYLSWVHCPLKHFLLNFVTLRFPLPSAGWNRTENYFMYGLQFGFRGSLLTNTSLIAIYGAILLIVIGLQATLDTVDHEILYNKLQAMRSCRTMTRGSNLLT